jgi:DNA-binding PadR family transcriptional regulator
MNYGTRINTIFQYFEKPPATYLNQELAVCYVLSMLLEKDSYGTELIQWIEQNKPSYRLSDTVLYSALKFLEDENLTVSYWKKTEGRGRPRRMLQIVEENRSQCEKLAQLWSNYLSSVD